MSRANNFVERMQAGKDAAAHARHPDLPGTAPACPARRLSQAPLRPAKPQLPCDHGLFSDEDAQLDLIEMLQEPVED